MEESWKWRPSPLPLAQRGLWKHRRSCVVSAHTDRAWGCEGRWGQRHQWCWGQTDASHVLLQCQGCCEALTNTRMNTLWHRHLEQNSTNTHNADTCMNTVFTKHTQIHTKWITNNLKGCKSSYKDSFSCLYCSPVMLTERAKATLASPTALRRAL